MRISLILLLLLASGAQAQRLQGIELDDLTAFGFPDSNWTVVGQVASDRSIEQHLTTEAGTGYLANQPTDSLRGHLFTAWEHQDLELDLEFMMPAGSNSGLYFMGRYEIQMLDSWGVKDLSFADLGAVYQRWDESRAEGERGYEGTAPSVNVARAPGLWQHFNIIFEAPRFDENGTKIRNARFARVMLNGVLIHENVEVTGPTRAAAFNDEAPSGPLMIQGDHGPVAFRNISFRRYGELGIEVRDLTFKRYESFWRRDLNFSEFDPVESGVAESLEIGRIDTTDFFGVELAGELVIPQDGEYTVTLSPIGSASLRIGPNEIDARGMHGAEAAKPPKPFSQQMRLSAGTHPLRFDYMKRGITKLGAAGITITGPSGVAQRLTPVPSVMSTGGPSEYEITPEAGEASVFRSFMTYKDEEQRRTHLISVGESNGIHYTVDTKTLDLLYFWKGGFVDASPMWFQRGQTQSATILGAPSSVGGMSGVAMDHQAVSWPRLPEGLRFRGYQLEESGRPVFRYEMEGLRIEDRIRPDESGSFLERTIVVAGEDTTIYFNLAEGEGIAPGIENRFIAGGGTVEVQVVDGAATLTDGRLLVPLRVREGEGVLRYRVVW